MKACCSKLYKSTAKRNAPNVGLEPTTLGLRVPCSTDWASRAAMVQSPYAKSSPKKLLSRVRINKIWALNPSIGSYSWSDHEEKSVHYEICKSLNATLHSQIVSVCHFDTEEKVMITDIRNIDIISWWFKWKSKNAKEMSLWSKADWLTASRLSPLFFFKSRRGHVRKLLVTLVRNWFLPGSTVFSTSYKCLVMN